MQLPAAISPLTRALVLGAPRPGVAVGLFPTAIYVRLDDDSGVGTVLPVVTSDALLLPTAARLAVTSAQVEWPVAVGDSILVGGGVIAGAGLEVRATRSWRPSRVADAGAVRAGDPAGLLPEPGELGVACIGILEAAREQEPTDVDRRVAGLVGRGAGLTPSGDDALCGLLLGLRAWRSPALAMVADSVARSRHRTTDLSASLLAAAADGYAVPQVVALVEALRTGDEHAVRARAAEVLAIGHSSGRDLLSGLAATLTSDRQCTKTDRQCTKTDRQCTKTDRQCTNTDRQCTKTDRQCTSPHRTHGPTPEGINRG